MSLNTHLEITDNAISPDSEIRAIYKGQTHVANGGLPPHVHVKFDYMVGDHFDIVLRDSENQLTTPITLAIVAFDSELHTEVISSDNWDVTIHPTENIITCNYIPEPSSSFVIPNFIQLGRGEIGIAIVGTTEEDVKVRI